MKKKKYPLKKHNQSKLSEASIDYKTNLELTTRKIFVKTPTSKNFPENCVTVDTFFSDLEDFIFKHEKI